MLGDEYFFEIPVYRCNIDTHTQEINLEREKWLNIIKSSGIPKEQAPESYKRAELFFDYSKWYPWQYNEIIGWIYLYRLGSSLRGDYWWTISKRIVRKGKKDYRYYGKAFELTIYKEETSDEIFQKLHARLKQLNTEEPFKKRFINIEALMTIAPFVNWRKLMFPNL